MITQEIRYLSYKYSPEDEHLHYAEFIDPSIQPDDYAIVNSKSRFNMCIVQVWETDVLLPSDHKKRWGSLRELFRCYGVFDKSKFDDMMEYEQEVLGNLSR